MDDGRGSGRWFHRVHHRTGRRIPGATILLARDGLHRRPPVVVGVVLGQLVYGLPDAARISTIVDHTPALPFAVESVGC